MIPALGAIPLSQLTPQDLQTYYGEKLASGRRDGKGGLSPRTVRHHHVTVGNQQKWDTFVKERSGGCGSIVGLPALPVVAFAPL